MSSYATATQRKKFSKLSDEEKQSAVRQNVRMEDAEQKARARERKAESALKKKLDGANGKVKELRDEAGKFGLGLYKKRERSNIRHVQLIQANLDLAFQNNLLSETEQHFLFRISTLVEFGSNAICKKLPDGSLSPCNITELSEIIGKARQNTSVIVNKLVRKGFLGVFVTGVDGAHPHNAELQNPARAKILFANPRIMHSGYNDDVNETLKRMFKDSFKRAPVKMF